MEDKNSSAHYKGYNSKSLGTNYDHISQQVRDKITNNGGIMDVKAEKNGGQELKGVRAVFSSKESRDNFNKELDKIKNKSKQQKEKKKDTIKAKTQSELDKEKINEIISQTIDSYLFENLKSPKLRNFSKLHGGLGSGTHGQSGNFAFTNDGWSEVPLSDITDDMLSDEIIDTHSPKRTKSYNGITFRDGTILPFKDKKCALDISDNLQRKQKERRNEKMKNNDGSSYYVSPTEGGHLARTLRQSLGYGYDTVNWAKEKKSEDGDRNQQYWDDFIQHGKNIVNRDKILYQKAKNDKSLENKTKRF